MSNKIYPVDAIKHPSDKRADIPTTEHAGEEQFVIADSPKVAKYKEFKNEFDRGRDPELYWLGKYNNDDEDTQSPDLKVDVRSLYVHEDIQPEMLIKRLFDIKEEKSESAKAQLELFSSFDNPTLLDDELEKVTNYYKHSAEWKNRLIQGDSLLVMNSLLKREGMAGKVQCVYIDPPYGIRFGSNWQISLKNNKMAHESKDEQCSGEPEMIKAFRDTWELGIHSYLTYLRDRLIIARELLSQSGSVFVQISDENVHLVRNLLDEIFGSENFVSQIFYKKTSGAGSPGELVTLPSVGDYIIWYAKDKEQYKFRKIFLPRHYGDPGTEHYNSIELEDGRRMSISQWERENGCKFDYDNRPKNSKVYCLDNFTSQSGGDIGRFDIELKGKVYKMLSNNVWKTNEKGVERLKKLNRLDVSNEGRVGYVRYFDDFNMGVLSNIWTDVASGFQQKMYVVQSGVKPIQRCILMATDPGDLVLDPTCGSGTTAYVAEQWGRRWITIDTSRIALNIAKKRLTSAVFPYYELFDSEGGDIRQGFNYKQVPHITLRSLAQDEPSDCEALYDQPYENKKKIRVSGPFTVETLQSFNVTSPEETSDSPDEVEENRLFQERIFSHLQTSGIRNGDKTQKAIFHNVEAVTNPFLNAKGYYRDDEGKERLAYFHIGPKFGSVSKLAVNATVQEFRTRLAEGASWLVLLGFSFEDSINDKDYNLGLFTVSKVRMHDDLMQDGLLKKDKGAGSFITIGEPDIEIVKDDDEYCHVEIKGLDIYDPIKDDVKARSVEDISYWEIDDNYNGSQFIVRGIHFCGGDKKEFNDWKKGLSSVASSITKKKAEKTLKLVFNDELWDNLYGFRSEPLKYEKGRKVAVRVVSQFGEESSKVLTM